MLGYIFVNSLILSNVLKVVKADNVCEIKDPNTMNISNGPSPCGGQDMGLNTLLGGLVSSTGGGMNMPQKFLSGESTCEMQQGFSNGGTPCGMSGASTGGMNACGDNGAAQTCANNNQFLNLQHAVTNQGYDLNKKIYEEAQKAKNLELTAERAKQEYEQAKNHARALQSQASEQARLACQLESQKNEESKKAFEAGARFNSSSQEAMYHQQRLAQTESQRAKNLQASGAINQLVRNIYSPCRDVLLSSNNGEGNSSMGGSCGMGGNSFGMGGNSFGMGGSCGMGGNSFGMGGNSFGMGGSCGMNNHSSMNSSNNLVSFLTDGGSIDASFTFNNANSFSQNQNSSSGDFNQQFECDQQMKQQANEACKMANANKKKEIVMQQLNKCMNNGLPPFTKYFAPNHSVQIGDSGIVLATTDNFVSRNSSCDPGQMLGSRNQCNNSCNPEQPQQIGNCS